MAFKLLEKIFPQRCVICGDRAGAGPACGACHRSLPRMLQACPVCAMPYTGTGPCGACQKDPPPFKAVHAAFQYQFPVDRLVTALKFGGRLDLARALGELSASELLPRITQTPDAIIPVPLHTQRLRERGFSQALEIARPIARVLQRPVLAHAAQRIRATEPQTRLPRAARATNVRAAFTASKSLAGLRVAVVDDVMTSGHTAKSLTMALHAAGCASVEVWVVARA